MVTHIVGKVKEYSPKIKKNVRKNEKANIDSILFGGLYRMNPYLAYSGHGKAHISGKNFKSNVALPEEKLHHIVPSLL